MEYLFNKITLILLLWTCSISFIVYKRNMSNNIILLTIIILTFIIINSNHIKKESLDINNYKIESHTEKLLISWTNKMINSENITEKDRCYIEILNILQSESLGGKNKLNYDLYSNILKFYKPETVLPVNITNDPYNVSLGFTKNT